MATADGDSLTRLVLGAHDRCIRVSISAHTFRQITIMMHSGRGRTGGVESRHRTMERALQYWRKYHPAEPGEITDQTLLKRAVRNARDRSTRGKHPRWVAVKNQFQLGSTSASELCRRFDLNPDEEVKA